MNSLPEPDSPLADSLPSTMLDLARYPADAFRALLNIKKQEPVTAMKRKETCLETNCTATILDISFDINDKKNNYHVVPSCVTLGNLI